ncbi:MAG: hypothetical protein HY744_27785 [Deltaproteobacteria bacterium]|nr:hypothetical protein [Deltaproteobacteria bacterium]
MKRSALVLGSAALTLLACGGNVTPARDGGAGGEGTTSGAGGAAGATGTGGAGTGGGLAGEAISILYSQLFPPSGSSSSGSSTSSSSSGSDIDPNTLYVLLSNVVIACADPHGNPCGRWEVSIGIPPNLQHPGSIPLSNPDLISMFSVASPDCESGSGGSFVDGSLVLASLDAVQVVGTLLDTYTGEFDANGDFTAPRCP